MITLISTKTNKQLACFNLLLDLEPVLWALIVAGVGRSFGTNPLQLRMYSPVWQRYVQI